MSCQVYIYKKKKKRKEEKYRNITYGVYVDVFLNSKKRSIIN